MSLPQTYDYLDADGNVLGCTTSRDWSWAHSTDREELLTNALEAVFNLAAAAENGHVSEEKLQAIQFVAVGGEQFSMDESVEHSKSDKARVFEVLDDMELCGDPDEDVKRPKRKTGRLQKQ